MISEWYDEDLTVTVDRYLGTSGSITLLGGTCEGARVALACDARTVSPVLEMVEQGVTVPMQAERWQLLPAPEDAVLVRD